MIHALDRLHQQAIIALEKAFLYRMSALHFHTEKGQQWLVKHRANPWLSYILANAFLMLSRARCRVLKEQNWLEREHDMYQLLHNREVRLEGRMLQLPTLPGKPLGEVLASPQYSMNEKSTAVKAALHSLHGMHKTHIDHSGLSSALSHSDATVSNVLFDSSQNLAHWIDFETVFVGLSEAEQHAEDLLTLLFSCAGHLSIADFSALLPTIIPAYAEKKLWMCAKCIIEEEQRRSRPYRLVQCRLSPGKKKQVDALLLAAIKQRVW